MKLRETAVSSKRDFEYAYNIRWIGEKILCGYSVLDF